MPPMIGLTVARRQGIRSGRHLYPRGHVDMQKATCIESGPKVRLMGHPVYKVTLADIVGPSRLRMEFDDGLVRTVDFRSVLEGEFYGPLRDLDQFNRVSVDHEARTLVWPNGADFDPAILHDWPEHEAGVLALAQRWAAAGG